jgi:Haem-degrading
MRRRPTTHPTRVLYLIGPSYLLSSDWLGIDRFAISCFGCPNLGVHYKALTACNFQMPNDALQAIGQSQPAFAVDLAKNADICLLGGGLPISLAKPLGTRIDSQCAGGLGIVGASEEIDRLIAEKAISLLLR